MIKVRRFYHPLDFVQSPGNGIAVVTEIDMMGKASISFLQGLNPAQEKSAWWEQGELKILDSLPWLLSRLACHPFGEGKDEANRVYGLEGNT